MGRIEEILAANDEILQGVKSKGSGIQRASRKVPAFTDPPVGRLTTSERLEREFFGTHYWPSEKPRVTTERPSAIQAVIHVFGLLDHSLIGSIPFDNFEIVHHNHQYNQGCFASYQCRMIPE